MKIKKLLIFSTLVISVIALLFLKTSPEARTSWNFFTQPKLTFFPKVEKLESQVKTSPLEQLQGESEILKLGDSEVNRIAEYLELKNKGIPTEQQKKKMMDILNDKVLIQNSLEVFNPGSSNRWVDPQYREERMNRLDFLFDVVASDNEEAAKKAEVGFLEIAMTAFPTKGFKTEDLQFALGDRVTIVGALSKINPTYFEVYKKQTQDSVQKRIIEIVEEKFIEKEKDHARQKEQLQKAHL